MRFHRHDVPWAIGTDVRDCHTAREVIEKAGLDFYVDKCELVARMPFSVNGDNTVNDTMGDFAYKGNIYRDCPNAYATYRTDTNIPLGLVKSKYTVVQNIDAFNFFNDAIGPDKAIWQNAGCYGYGERIYIAAKLPIETTVKGDKIDNYLVFSNSHDGTSSLNILFTPVRVICTNMLNAALNNSDSYIRIRHTKTAHEKLQTGAEILKIACEYASSAQQLYEALTVVNMKDEDVMRYLANLVLSDGEISALTVFDKDRGYQKLYARDYLTLERTGISTRKVNTIVRMFEYYLDGIGQREICGTAWGAYNAVTGYYSNVANLEGEKRMDSLLYGGSNTATLKALNYAAEYAEAV